MTKHEITHIIKDIFRQIKKIFPSIIEKFEPESIHKFRVQIKKLNAFLRLLSFGMEEPGYLKLPKSLKKIYSLAGKVRSLQLQLLQTKSPPGKELELKEYNMQLEKELNDCIDSLKILLDKKMIITKEKKIISKIPENIDKKVIINFYQLKINDIKSIVESGKFSDEALHSIRKLIKDMIFISKIIRKSGMTLSSIDYLKEENLSFTEKMAQELGEYNDICSGLQFLTSAYFNKINPAEKKTLVSVRLDWNARKKFLKSALIRSIKNVPVLQVN